MPNRFSLAVPWAISLDPWSTDITALCGDIWVECLEGQCPRLVGTNIMKIVLRFSQFGL